MKTIAFLLMGVLTTLTTIAQTTAKRAPRTYLFVHGAWGGGWEYKKIDSILTAQGDRVYHPTMTGLGERVHLANPDINLSTHVADIVNVFRFEGLHDVILVGHSYGGMVISGVAEQIPESVISAELQSVNDQIANAGSYPEIIERAEDYLLRKLRTIKIDAHPIDRIGLLLLHNPTPFSLDWLANQANLSPRQFERTFNERMGIGPKLYSRISRFYQTFAYKEAYPRIDWLTVAVQSGYTDYDHLAKDFKQFTNVTPNIILREYAQRPEMIVNL